MFVNNSSSVKFVRFVKQSGYKNDMFLAVRSILVCDSHDNSLVEPISALIVVLLKELTPPELEHTAVISLLNKSIVKVVDYKLTLGPFRLE